MATVASHRLSRCYCNRSVESTADNDAPAALPVSGAADAASDHRVCRTRIFEVEFGRSICKHSRSMNASCLMELKKS